MTNTWKDSEKVKPKFNEPCEYIIQVKCRGWFRPSSKEFSFAPDERQPPQSKIIMWRGWEDGENWSEGKELVRKFRKHKQQEMKIQEKETE